MIKYHKTHFFQVINSKCINPPPSQIFFDPRKEIIFVWGGGLWLNYKYIYLELLLIIMSFKDIVLYQPFFSNLKALFTFCNISWFLWMKCFRLCVICINCKWNHLYVSFFAGWWEEEEEERKKQEEEGKDPTPQRILFIGILVWRFSIL